MNDQLHALAALVPEKTLPYSLDKRLGNPQCRCRTNSNEKRNVPAGNRTGIPQVASQYSDYTQYDIQEEFSYTDTFSWPLENENAFMRRGVFTVKQISCCQCLKCALKQSLSQCL